jgi:DNA polymerase III subunit delta'
MFDHIVGNAHAKAYLTRIVERKTIGNSLLFAGPEGVGKSLFAEAFAKLVLCSDDPQGKHKAKIEAGNHPDIRVYRPEGKIGMHSIASMRHFSEEVYLAPYEAKWKVFIIHDADRMLTYSANALLKTFEEPSPDSIILLLSNAPASLLPTVLSRCRTVHFHALSEEEMALFLQKRCGKNAEEAAKIAALAQGSLGYALKLARDGGSKTRDIILHLLAKGGVSTYRQLSDTAAEIAAYIEQTKKQADAEARALWPHASWEDLTAVQRQNIEKEIEGAITMSATAEAHALFSIILSWYRDLQLQQLNGNKRYLIHRDYALESEQAVQRGEILPIEMVQKMISHERLMLERSTAPNICFENLFLQLNLLKG